MGRTALLWLMVAVLLGGLLRFTDLDRLEMSDDEGASWAAAAQPTLAAVIAAQAKLNPGKMAVHEIALHGWMTTFGDSIVAQRSLSALLGTISIVVVFWIGWELCASPAAQEDGSAAMIAGFGAMVYAVNLVTIKYTREARMYPVMLTAILLHVGFFVRASRRGGILNYLGTAIFAIVAITSNFAAALVPASEGFWLLYLLERSGVRLQTAESDRAWSLIAALALAAIAFFALSMSALRGAVGAVERGAITWIRLPEPWAPIALFNKATGSFGFPIFLIVAAWGVARGWRRERDAVAFSLLWMWGPPLLMLIVSYAMRPLFVERYALSSFAAFFILVGIGIQELEQRRWQIAALLIVVAVSLGHIVVFNRKPHDAQWREAAQLGIASLHPGETMTAVPAYSISVVRYYLPPADRQRTVDYTPGSTEASVVLLRDHGVSSGVNSAIHQEYSVELTHLRGVIILRK